MVRGAQGCLSCLGATESKPRNPASHDNMGRITEGVGAKGRSGRTHRGRDRVTQFLVLIEWLNEILKLIAAAAFGALVVLVLIGFGVLDVERKREP